HRRSPDGHGSPMMPAPTRLHADDLARWSSSTKIEPQRATVAERRRAAVRLADGDEQGVKLVEQRGVRREMRLHEGARVLVARDRADQAMPRQYTPGVRVGDEHRTTGGIEEDRVHGLRTEAGHTEQATAQR